MATRALSRIAIGQICSSSDLTRNFNLITDLISKAVDNNVGLIFFPEAADYLSKDANHSKKLVEESPRFVKNLQGSIKALFDQSSKKIDVAIGVHLPATSEDRKNGETRVKNVLLYINHEGKIIESYQKLHLFDVDVPNGPILKESNSVQPGSKVASIVSSPAGKLGLGICYDIRFPELSLELRSRGAEILCFPSAFTMKTGAAHWELLGRARAIDTQCFVVMPGQSGKHDVNADNHSLDSAAMCERVSWGHSMIIDPFGNIISQADLDKDPAEPQLIFADLDFEVLKTFRANMPLWKQRRNDIFK